MRNISVAIAAALLGTLTAPVAAHANNDVTRILIVGDSVTQGSRGQYTYRYFLDRHLTEAGMDFDFVGSSRGVFDNWNWNYTDADAYADPSFDQDHSSVAGGRIEQDGHSLSAFPVGDEIERHQPDVIVSLWGINDLGASTAEQALGYYRDWFARARAADPAVDFVVGKLPYTWADEDVPAFNDGLAVLAAEVTTSESTIIVAEMQEPYSLEDSVDHVHPNMSGEQKISRMMASALTPAAPEPQPEPAPTPVAPEPQAVTPAVIQSITPPVTVPATPSRPAVVKATRRGKVVKVRWQKATAADTYRVRCGGKVATAKGTRVKIRTTAKRCKVQAVNAVGSSAWKAVRVRR